jgi:hypothetical protein
MRELGRALSSLARALEREHPKLARVADAASILTDEENRARIAHELQGRGRAFTERVVDEMLNGPRR